MFFSSVASVPGFKYFNLHYYKASELDIVHLMKQKRESTTVLKDCFLQHEVLPKVFSDNAKEFKTEEVTNYLKIVVDREFNEPKHRNQNLAERRGDVIKVITAHLLQVIGVPLNY